MHLQCPNCQQTLQVPEQYIGQQMQCPLCKNTFTVPGTPETSVPTAPPVAQPPATPPAPPVPPPVDQPPEQPPASFVPEQPPSEPATFTPLSDPVPPAPPLTPPAEPQGESPVPPPLTPPVESSAPPPMSEPVFAPEPPVEPTPPSVPTPAPAAPAPPVTPGEYRKVKTIWISPRVVPWLAPICVGVVFILTFLPFGFLMETRTIGSASVSAQIGGNAWALAFGERTGNAIFIIYDLMIVFGMLFAIFSFLMHRNIIPDLPQLQPVKPYRSLIVAIFLGIPFVLLAVKMLIDLFSNGVLPYSFWGILAFKLHAVALIGSLLELCLQKRDPSQPIPRIEIKW